MKMNRNKIFCLVLLITLLIPAQALAAEPNILTDSIAVTETVEEADASIQTPAESITGLSGATSEPPLPVDMSPKLPVSEETNPPTLEETIASKEIFTPEQSDVSVQEQNTLIDAPSLENAEQEVFTVEPPPRQLMDKDPAADVDFMPLNTESWIGKRYGDQLTDRGARIYKELETQFANGTISYQNITYNVRENGVTKQIVEFCAVYDDTELLASFKVENVPLDGYKDEYQRRKQEFDSEIAKVYLAFTYDHPEYFWIRTYGNGSAMGKITYRPVGNGLYTYEINLYASISYVINEQYKEEAIREQYQSRINQVINSILGDCSNMPVIAKLAYFDNWLAENNDYNSTAASTTGYSQIDTRPWNTIGGFLSECEPVCEGYAKAFQLLCHKIGLNCVTVSSSGHMWNAVELNGDWFYVDSTWDDPVITGTNKTRDYSTREHFLVCSFSDSSHIIAMSLATPAVASKNYFPASGDWSFNGKQISGYMNTATDRTRYMALYTTQGKLLKIAPCYSFKWIQTTERTIAPDFSESVLSQASYIKVFTLSDWTPKEADVRLPK